MSKPTPEELLAAYAHRPGDLSAEERREVEALLARSPAAAREVEDDRDVLLRIAELPAEGTEPAWEDLERSIRVACADEPPGLWARMLASLRGWKPAAGLGAGLVVAMAALLLWLGRSDREVPVARTTPDGEAAPPEVAQALAGLEAPDGDELDDDGEAIAAETDETLADWGALAPGDGALDDTDLAWLDTLDDAELDAVAAWLDAQEPS
jgi:hypothetical protein